MNKKIIATLAATVFLLSACSDPTGEDSSGNTVGTPGKADTTSTTNNQLSDDYYKTVITNGSYQVSKTRGSTLGLNSNFNLKAFETGLMSLSQLHFSTEDYYFQEGQYIDSTTANKWLRRVSEENPDGLNPADNGKKEPNERTPDYLNSVLEQNYMVKKGDKFSLGGISIGLSMNAIDYYQKVAFGADYETKISRDELLKQGQEMANKIVQRLRETEGVGDIPIAVGIFEQSPKDSLAGGSFIAEAISEKGDTRVGEWEVLNQEKVVFPLVDKTSNELTNFENFKSEVEYFFPNLSGVTAEASYTNDQLVKMKVDIVTQFYGESEIIGFTQYVAEKAATFLPPNIPIEITIGSINGTESFMARKTGETTFITHVFN
ncbi:Protein involved in sex pheromone biosynthesis [Carnobacterium iners]|uniref:Protein involved in sex pheromone biosynthesis n=1 Tax=Carnobacterium iners TaxID=1073423 RepID=A0A1X7N8W2_9LACT|nr:CamS family sex pheromone protein [Carnobacterium iners]SEK47640.1 Protein involved in sex pheromone biosynthesis [Carnobacterium iners]SMH33369.1 Protein involved in sex pheromone biosynthesis [Carnobacterium iners]